MKRAQQARKCLKGHWTAAVAVECIIAAAGMLIPLAFLASLRFFGLSAEKMTDINDLIYGEWLYAAVTLALLLMDWLILSPLILGRQLFYWQLASGCNAPAKLILNFYGRRYVHSLRWRLSMFLWRILCWVVCMLPAAAITGIAKAVRQNGVNSAVTDVILLFSTFFGFIFFVAGLLVIEIMMIRRLPSTVLIFKNDTKKYPKRLFKNSARIMKGHVADTFQLVTGFGGWFTFCLLIFPYLYVAPLFFTTRMIAVRQFTMKSMGKSWVNLNAVTQDTVSLPDLKDKKQPC